MPKAPRANFTWCKPPIRRLMSDVSAKLRNWEDMTSNIIQFRSEYSSMDCSWNERENERPRNTAKPSFRLCDYTQRSSILGRFRFGNWYHYLTSKSPNICCSLRARLRSCGYPLLVWTRGRLSRQVRMPTQNKRQFKFKDLVYYGSCYGWLLRDVFVYRLWLMHVLTI